jgi:hypothetical protein
MQLPRRLAAAIGLIATAGTVAALGAGPAFVAGSDHLDAPTAKHDARIDITDLYAFKSGAGTTLIMNVNPLTSPASSKTARFATNALYQFKIDVTGDAVADIVYRVRFADTRFASDGAVVQTYTIKRDTQAAARVDAWTGSTIAIGGTTAYGRSPRISPTLGGGRAFAGVRDDPFYFDLAGFVQFKSELLKGTTTLGSPGGGAGTLLGGFTGTDTFAGTNTSAIAIWVPDSRLGGTGGTSECGRPPPTERPPAGIRSTGSAVPRSIPCSTACTCRPPAPSTTPRRKPSTGSGRPATAQPPVTTSSPSSGRSITCSSRTVRRITPPARWPGSPTLSCRTS